MCGGHILPAVKNRGRRRPAGAGAKGTAAAPRRPTRYGAFEVRGEIGGGGTGTIYDVRDDQGTRGALKVPASDEPLYRDLLRREVAMMNHLSTCNFRGVPRVLASESDTAAPWYVMEYVDGPELSTASAAMLALGGVQQDRLYDPAAGLSRELEREATQDHLRAVLKLAREIARILAFVHGEGIVHGDLSPRNVILRGGMEPVLIDFGAALRAAVGGTARDVAQGDGEIIGTSAYMAPERILGQRLDSRCDLYALGCVLFELVTGRPPFVGDSDTALRQQHVSTRAPALSSVRRGVPAALDSLMARLLVKEPADRLGYAEEIIAAIEEVIGQSTPPAEVIPSAPLFKARLVGRAAQLDELKARVPTVQGGGGVAFLTGESGIGKTRLAKEIVSHARSMGADVVTAECTPGAPGTGTSLASTGLHAFRPFLRRVADVWASQAVPEWSRPLGTAVKVLERYEPRLGQIANDESAPAPPASSADGRKLVMESLDAVLRAFAATRPLVIVIDDAQWADEITLEYLTRRDAPRWPRLLTLVCYRNDEADATVRRLDGAIGDAHIELPRLLADDARALTRDLLAARLLPEGLAETIFAQSDGNPFFVAECLRAAITRRQIAWDPRGGWHLSGRDVSGGRPDLATPETIENMFELRVAKLGEEAQRLLDLAAIIGREFALSWLTAISRAQGGAAPGDAAIQELIARQIIEDAGGGRCRFVHDQLRESRARRIPAEVRTHRHKTVAESLEALARAGVEDLPGPAELGVHWAQAGEPERALVHLRHAARSAESVFATTQAAELYRMAVEQVELLMRGEPQPWSAMRQQLNESLADLLLRDARHREARVRYRAALEIAGEGDRLYRARLHRKLGESCWTLHEYGAAIAELAVAESLLGPIDRLAAVDEKREWIEVKCGQFSVRYFSRQAGDETVALIRELKPVIDEYGTVLQRTLFYQNATGDLLARGRYAYSEEALDLARRGLSVAEGEDRGGSQRAEARLTLGFALLLGDRDNAAEAVDVLDQALREARATGERTLATRALAYLALGVRRLRDLPRTIALAEELRTASEAAGLAPYMAVAEACAAWTHFQRGDVGAAVAGAERARTLWRSSGHPFPFRWVACLLLAQAHRDRGEWEALPELVSDLLAPDQQRLPDDLAAALARLQQATPVDPRQVDDMLAAARRSWLL
jgi:serine/threonine protein kinase/predicted ATPase